MCCLKKFRQPLAQQVVGIEKCPEQIWKIAWDSTRARASEPETGKFQFLFPLYRATCVIAVLL